MKTHLPIPLAVTRLAGVLVLSGLFTSPSEGLVLRSFNAASHLRMINFPSNPSINPTFLNPGGAAGGRLDLTGVGWSVQDTRKQFTLVSPRHFLGANHFRPAPGSQVRFLAKDGSLHTFTVGAVSAIPNANDSSSDVFLGEFTSELSGAAPVLPLPYLNLLTDEAYVGEALVIVGQAARGGRGTIASVADFGGDPLTGGTGIQTRAFTFTYGPVGGGDDAHAEGGDSGSPSFAVRSDKAALVGTHTAVAQALGTVTTFDTLVPHYVPELNSRMAAVGLRMRKINPPATSFSASGGPVEMTVRSGAPFSFRITISNGSNTADNITADVTQGTGPAVSGISAVGWFPSASSQIRRGGLGAAETSVIQLSFVRAPASGDTSIMLKLKSDGSVTQSFQFPLAVLTSFAEWATELDDMSPTGDSDGDGVSNLIEYATGGDNTVNSRFFPNEAGDTSLLPRFATAPPRLSFLRRMDASVRGLSYIIETSTTLEPGTWQKVEGAAISFISSPGPGIEEISAALPDTSAENHFYRLRIELNE